MRTPETNIYGKGWHFIEQDLDDVAFHDPLKPTTEQETDKSEVMDDLMRGISAFFIEAAVKQAKIDEFNRLYPEPEVAEQS